MILWKNGVFHTMEDPDKTHYQMATDQGLIVGFDQEVDKLVFRQEVDLLGNHVYPGFVDSHIHLLGYGLKLITPNLKQIKDRQLVINSIKSFYNNEPLFVQGYFECGLTKADLNKISTKQPILLRHNDYHSVTVNKAVLSRINVESISGILTEQDAQAAVDSFEKLTNEKLVATLKIAIKSLHGFGVTGAHSDDLFYFNGYKDTVSAFQKTLLKMPFRAHLLIHHAVLNQYLADNKKHLVNNKYLELGSVGEIFYDGTLSSKTALMMKPYKGLNNYGLKVQSDHEFTEIIKKARKHNLAVSVHAMGDQALLNVIKILKRYPPYANLCDRLIHTPFMNDEIIGLLKKMPVILDIQPQFLASDLPWALTYLSEYPQYVFPWNTLLKNKVGLAAGSDAPVEDPNPLLGIYAAITRESNHNGKAYFSNEKISRFQAISLYTSGANKASLSNNKGYLRKGFIADLAVYTDNLLTMNIEVFKKNITYATIVDEKIVYCLK